MLYKYKRAARTHQERALGPLSPLVLAIPALAELADKAWTTGWTTSPGAEELTPTNSPAGAPTYAVRPVVQQGLQRLDSNQRPGG